jgi:addiction module HigA family antidote
VRSAVRSAHPGGIVRRQCLEPLGLDVDDAATRLGIDPDELRGLTDERAPVTPAIAAAFQAAGWSTAKLWLALQRDFDEAKHEEPGAATVGACTAPGGPDHEQE